jgi:hypothetical protein
MWTLKLFSINAISSLFFVFKETFYVMLFISVIKWQCAALFADAVCRFRGEPVCVPLTRACVLFSEFGECIVTRSR